MDTLFLSYNRVIILREQADYQGRTLLIACIQAFRLLVSTCYISGFIYFFICLYLDS